MAQVQADDRHRDDVEDDVPGDWKTSIRSRYRSRTRARGSHSIGPYLNVLEVNDHERAGRTGPTQIIVVEAEALRLAPPAHFFIP